jgi:uncharacterized protein (DUF2384 family)
MRSLNRRCLFAGRLGHPNAWTLGALGARTVEALGDRRQGFAAVPRVISRLARRWRPVPTRSLAAQVAAVGATNLLHSCYTRGVSSSVLVPQPLIREAVYLHEIALLTDADIARATGVARSTARAWLAHTRSPTGERAERLIELSALVERLARVMEPSYIAVWLRKPVPALEEHKPIDVIAGGGYMRVAELVSTLEEASFS